MSRPMLNARFMIIPGLDAALDDGALPGWRVVSRELTVAEDALRGERRVTSRARDRLVSKIIRRWLSEEFGVKKGNFEVVWPCLIKTNDLNLATLLKMHGFEVHDDGASDQ